MVAAGNTDHVAIGDSHGLVQLAVIGIDALDAKPVGRVQAVVIGLFQIGDPGEVILVMAVAGIGGPVTCRGEDFGHQ